MFSLIRGTFRLLRGMGAARERRLWAAGVRDWSQLAEAPAALLPRALRTRLCAAAAVAEQALAEGALEPLARALPGTEHWRLYHAFADQAVFLDIETDRWDGITAIGLLDRDGPRLLLAGRDRERLPALLPASCLLVTFNGRSFDLPWLRRTFPEWTPPVAHIDLCHAWRRLGHHGGLKQLEVETGRGRPDHLRDLDGSAACWLWRHGQRGDRRALRTFAEYNLYDVVNLRPLAAVAYNRLAADAGFPDDPAPISERGDVLYDVSKILLSL
jgi:uncharacterized protein YprB with RNaseH-like and TPR domain